VTDEPTRTPRKPSATRPAAKGAKNPAAKAPRKSAKPAEATAVAAATDAIANEAAASQPKRARGTAGRPEPIGLRLRYRDDVVPALVREFGYANPMEVPRLEKVVVNIGLGEAIQNAKAIDAAVGDLALITGQKPIVTRATRSIAQFRLRTGMPVGAKVTLRGQRMYDFLERTMRLALPRIRDFRGVSPRSFDGRGNFSLGLREQLMYPEIDYDKIDRLRGLEISIVTTARTDEEGRRLLTLLGMPFAAT
jgi:large subunit ribosomal protein L5